MAESAHPRLYHSLRRIAPGGLPRVLAVRKAELALGIAGAAVAALFVSTPLSIALMGAVATFALSALEIEPFLLLVVFLLPIVWVLPADLPLRNVPVAFRSVVVAGFFLGRLWRGRVGTSRLLRPSLSWASLLFLGAVLASGVLVQGAWTHDSARAQYEMASDLGFFFVVLAWADSQLRVRKVLKMLLCSTAVTLGFAILQELVGGFTPLWFYLNPVIDSFQPWSGRAASFMYHPNSLAGYLNLMLPFALACYVIGKGKWKKLGGCIAGVGFAVMLCTQSVGGLVAFGCMLVLAIFCFVRTRRRRLLLLAGGCALALGFYFAWDTLNPAHAGSNIGQDASIRLFLWEVAWNLFVQSPIIGVGWGNFPTLYGSYINLSWIPPGIFDVHNIYLQLLSETGILGFVTFFWLVFLAAREAWRQWRALHSELGRALAFGVLGAIVTLLVQGLVDSQFTAQFEALFWTLLALLAANASVEARKCPTATRVVVT